MTGIETGLVLAAACGSGAHLLVSTTVFAPMRSLVAARTRDRMGGRCRFFEWLDSLLSCAYCTGTWLALGSVAVYRPVLITIPGASPAWSYWPAGYLAAVLFVNGLGMLPVLIIRKALRG